QNDVLANIHDKSTFIGYDTFETNTTISNLITENGFVKEATEGEEVSIILEETPFYAKCDGHVADNGIIQSTSGKDVCQDVQKTPNGQHLHQVKIVEGTLHKDEVVTAQVNQEIRDQIEKNHTATHLLHQALRDILGSHIHQAGSLVRADRLRFDFTHFEATRD